MAPEFNSTNEAGDSILMTLQMRKLIILTTKLPILIFLNTVHSNKSNSYKHKIKGSDTEKILQQLKGWQLTKALTEAV